MKESTKSIGRRIRDTRYVTRFLVGDGVDIGGKPDPLTLHRHLLPLMEEVRVWDLEDGDAQFMSGVDDCSYDFIYSSHTLEHMNDPIVAFENWFRILRPGGHMVISVPDEDLYEQGDFEKSFNRHHKHSFTILKSESWSEKSINVTELVASLGSSAQLILVNLEDTHYRYDIPKFDQTRAPLVESAIDLVIRRRTSEEILDKGRIKKPPFWPEGTEIHFNQYVLDQKAAALKYPEPFGETK
jgi:SAM-dependent methyltransferase